MLAVRYLELVNGQDKKSGQDTPNGQDRTSEDDEVFPTGKKFATESVADDTAPESPAAESAPTAAPRIVDAEFRNFRKRAKDFSCQT